ncbi:hypothetical protein [Allorhizocola rhizosphaerae]|uniref:hypothetical protein n=1 Tax=Allorhizocola rhizosphaerae TaxID=1872709 RepID=UPI000E3EC5A6|nr:hypothetical protein [Allorhizocola rhizosphaerae]
MPSTNTTSTLTSAETAFGLLTCEPAPLVFDARPVPGLPNRTMPLDELRTLLVGEPHYVETTDAVWRQLAAHAREWGPEWVVGAVGVALPGLTRMAARIARAAPRHADDIDSELLAGFLQALKHAPLGPPRVWLRFCWSAWRAGVSVIKGEPTEELPADLSTGSRSPALPYGHPELILGRAVAAGVVTAAQAQLIAETRFGDALMEQLATELGVPAPALRMRRRRAERAVAKAVLAGDLSGPIRFAHHRSRPVVAAAA